MVGLYDLIFHFLFMLDLKFADWIMLFLFMWIEISCHVVES
jgi:hypothetical protein